MKRQLLRKILALSLLPFAGLVSSCQGSSSFTVPTFAKSAGVDFIAYAGPTVANWAGNNHNPNTLTDEHYQKLAAAGFTKVLALYEGATSATGDLDTMVKARQEKAEKDALTALSLAEKYHLGYYVRDWSYDGLVSNYLSQGIKDSAGYESIIAKLFTKDNPYLASSSYAGNSASDEPTYEQLAQVAEQVSLYNHYVQAAGAKGESWVNLLPCYTLGAGLSEDKSKTYTDYVDYYFAHIAPLTGYVSWDFYPFKSDYYDGSYLRETYLYNLELMALRCKAGGYQMRTFLQDRGDWTGLRDMTSIGDFRFQVYNAMAFGSQAITYYTYVGENSQSDGQFALMDYETGEYNWTYGVASKVNNEVHAMEDAYRAYHWSGAMAKNANPLYDNQNFANMTSLSESDPHLEISACDQDTLAGIFENDEGAPAYMVTNFTDPYFQKNDTVTLTFKGAKGLLMYRLGQKVVVTLPTSGSYSMVLAPGEGRFCIPLY
jgi:hypothetical protein